MKTADGRHLMSVSEVCGRMKITRKTLFYYDRIGLLSPAERAGPQNHKMYTETEMRRLEEILQYRIAGLTIREIECILDQENAVRKAVLSEVLDRLLKEKKETDEKIIAVRRMLESI